jgi:hypothetical protein
VERQRLERGRLVDVADRERSRLGHRRARRQGLCGHRGHPPGRPRREMGRVGVERPRRRQRRRERMVFDDHRDQCRDRHRLVPLRHRDVPERAWRPARRQHRVLRRDGMAPGRVRRRRQRPVERHRPRASARRSDALRGRELHQRRWRPQALSAASFARTDHRLPDTHGDRRPGAHPDVTRPATSLRRTHITQSARTATFRFASGEPGSTFSCKFDSKPFRPCTSPKTYSKLTPGAHVLRVKARDRAGNLDATPAVKRFTIRRR